MLDALFSKVAGLQAYNFIKKRLQHKCNYCEVFKKIHFEELRTAASKESLFVSCAIPLLIIFELRFEC